MTAGAQPVLLPWSPAPAQLTMAYSVCRGITRANAKNFYYAFLVLPKRKRQALCAVYAFMRRCDDITDDSNLSLEERRYKLDTWLDALHRVQQGEPSDDPILLALTDAQRRYTIPAGLLDELAMGTAMDVVDPEAAGEESRLSANAVPGLTIQYRTFDDLKVYCYRVASVVGLVCIHVFGYRDPAAEPLAEQCGLAFQLTNIVRDVKEDAVMGRVYLPEEDLARFGLSAAELLSTPDPARFRPLLALEADRARQLYQSGEQLIPYISEDSQPALWVLVNIYRRLLEKIAERQYDVFNGKVSLTVSEKLRVLGKGFLQRLT
ncbi:MAG TPA: phytoene/squalene synthase family protein [Candidatus Sulfotelmatobacter sp.]|jgi:15-cis-phytoene synthase|nr:phytoene/squalene synthase family protein [Candidatus Sulfotelmatobacter sp.]